ncbi:MAG TPA: ATP synthase F0 subunit B [Syntrophales bacterium]|nr:ATP synthase F0 subunit B [Syntrophales bacterium]HOL58696.1 ATP synthase F0 subunit B [Syntrophales bacterium]HPO35016.1 ATP synthase F0 subunit B [Syntrophales bacterium]
MISIDKTLFLQMVNFILLMIILNYLLYRPLLGIIEKRKKILESSAAEVESLNKTIEEKQKEYEEKLRLAKQEALDLKARILKEANDEAKAMIDEKRNKIPAMMAEVQERVAKEVEAARKILQGQSKELSQEIAEKVLGRSL